MKRPDKLRINQIPWHPVIIALFPVLTLLAYNVAEIKLSEGTRSLIGAFCLGVTLLVISRLIIKDWYKAAAVASLALILFSSYGHFYNYLEPISLAGLAVGRHRVLVPVYMALFGLGIWWITRSMVDIKVLTRALNVVSITALIIPVLQISIYAVREASAEIVEPSTGTQQLSYSESKSPPDIYYIILDGYSRDDVLKNFYGYDNRSFLDELSASGFYVARCSQSNYSQTQLSLSSALNLNYLSELGQGFTEDRTDRVGMPGLIKHSAVRQLLEDLGYTMVAFETGYYWTQVEDAGVYISSKSSVTNLLDITGGLNGFESLLIKTSAGLILADGATILPRFMRADLDHPQEIHRQRVLFTLDQLGKLANMPGPKFVFAHIVSPHRPFVFGPQGESVDHEKEPIIGYRDQVAYLNSRMVPILQKIITDSATPPIIIIQGDHGGVDTSGKDRLAILNVYYLPDGGDQQLHENITPVNTFRLIFNYYFGGQYDLLEDASYSSAYKTPFALTPIPNSRPGCP